MKIKKVLLNNYRGYKYEEFNFVDGLNTIIGKSDAGKSALIKGIRFVTENDQSGNIVSEWILNDKGKIIKGEACWVELHTMDDHIVRREINSKSSTDGNFYTIDNGKPIGLTNGKAVPEDVIALLNLSEVNLQSQFETHFMLNENASTVAKTLNKMVNLEIIDESIANINKIVRKIKKEKDASDSNITTYAEKMEQFNFLEQMEIDVILLEELESSLSVETLSKQKLDSIFTDICEIGIQLNEIKIVSKHEDVVEDLLGLYEQKDMDAIQRDRLLNLGNDIYDAENCLSDVNKILQSSVDAESLLGLFESKVVETKEYNKLVDCIEEIESLEESLKSFTDLDSYQYNVTDLLKLYDELAIEKESRRMLSSTLVDIDEYVVTLKRVDKIIKKNYALIDGELCPLCGAEMKEGEHED